MKPALIACLMTLVLAACTSNPVQVDYDTQARFGELKTWAWQYAEQPASEDPLANNALVDERIRAAIEQALAAKGHEAVPADKAGYRVAYRYSIERDVLQQPSNPQMGVGIGGGSGGHFGGGISFNFGIGEQASPLRETLVIDILDAQSGKLLWRGFLTTTLSSGKPSTTAKNIRDAVNAILAKFPPAAKP